MSLIHPPRLLRPTWLEIDLGAVAENLRTVRRLVGPARKIFAVVKADGYGFGTVEMAEAFAEHGADAIAVADTAEGARLKKRGLGLPILVYPSFLPEVAAELIELGLIPTLVDLESARAFSAAAAAPVPVFVKVDVGLERLGVAPEEAVAFVRAIRSLPHLRLEGLCTHLHTPAGADPAYIGWQFSRFTAVIDALAAEGIEVPIRLAASSPLVLRHPETYLNAVDPGRILYGLPAAPGPGAVVHLPIPLAPAFRALRTRLIAVKPLAPRDRFTAEAPFPVTAPMRLGIVPAGAADGLATLHAGRVLVRGRSAPILGAPSLEHTRIDLTALPEATVGYEVTLIGCQGDAEISLLEVASRHGRPANQLAPTVGPRVARVYVSRGAIVRVRTE